jgi:hypothetical protein
MQQVAHLNYCFARGQQRTAISSTFLRGNSIYCHPSQRDEPIVDRFRHQNRDFRVTDVLMDIHDSNKVVQQDAQSFFHAFVRGGGPCGMGSTAAAQASRPPMES